VSLFQTSSAIRLHQCKILNFFLFSYDQLFRLSISNIKDFFMIREKE
jgi:hypothetical protein